MDQFIKGAHGKILGKITTINGKEYAVDVHGNRYAYFDGKYTCDLHGKRLAEGNILASVVMNLGK